MAVAFEVEHDVDKRGVSTAESLIIVVTDPVGAEVISSKGCTVSRKWSLYSPLR